MSGIVGRIKSAYETHGDKLRFLVVGVFNTAFGYLLFIVMLVLLGAVAKGLAAVPGRLPSLVAENYYLIAQWLSWVLAVPVGTMTMKYFAFHSRGHLLHEIGRAYLVYLPGLALSSVILWFTVQVLHISPAIGQLVTIGVATVFSYLGHKYFTFRTRPEPEDVRPLDLWR